MSKISRQIEVMCTKLSLRLPPAILTDDEQLAYVLEEVILRIEDHSRRINALEGAL